MIAKDDRFRSPDPPNATGCLVSRSMFIHASRREAQTFDPSVVRPLHVRPIHAHPSLREEHARMLSIAAARRLRAVERASHQRPEDAGYWKEVAPFAVARAVVLRAQPALRSCPRRGTLRP